MTGTECFGNHPFDWMARGVYRLLNSLDAAVNLVPEDAPHVPQTRCCHRTGELNGTARHHLDHDTVVVILSPLHH